MTTKELCDYVTMCNILKEKDPGKREHQIRCFYILNQMNKKKQNNNKPQ